MIEKIGSSTERLPTKNAPSSQNQSFSSVFAESNEVIYDILTPGDILKGKGRKRKRHKKQYFYKHITSF